MSRSLRLPNWATRSGRRTSKSRRTLAVSSPYQRRLVCEPLEDRRRLSIVSPQIELFKVSPALFVENRGQWPDTSIRYIH